MKIIVAAVAVVLTLAGCAAAPVAAAAPAHTIAVSIPSPKRIVPSATVTFAVYGDSITAWDPPYTGNPAQSWTLTTSTGDVQRVGGWALPGAKIDAMLAHAAATDANYVVIMAGTNDVFAGTPIPQRLAEIDSIIQVSQAHQVIISAVAPYNRDPASGRLWNDVLRQHAANKGWLFIDPWSAVRAAGNTWTPGADRGDGVHPNPSTAATVGAVIRGDLVNFSWEALLP